MSMPGWLDELIARVCQACVSEVKGRMSGFSCRWSEPAGNTWEAWLLQMAPAVVEISGGKDDGETVFDPVDVDLLALPECLDEVESFEYDPAVGQQEHLVVVGKKGEYDVVIEIYLEPFEDDAPQAIFDVNNGGWRNKDSDQI